ncbi:MAG: hypothetical protein ACP6IP_03860 [Candidatus Njordarchaeia archaeon]
MPIKFISIIDETGNEMLSSPESKGIKLVGGIISAISEVLKSLELKDLEKVSTGSGTIYVNKINSKLSLVILVDSSEKRGIYDEYVKWLIDALKREINQRFKGGDFFFLNDSIAVLKPLLDRSFEAHRDVEDTLLRLGKLYRTAKDIIGIKADKIIGNCQGDAFELTKHNGEFYIKKSNVGFEELLGGLNKCIKMIKGVLRELL